MKRTERAPVFDHPNLVICTSQVDLVLVLQVCVLESLIDTFPLEAQSLRRLEACQL